MKNTEQERDFRKIAEEEREAATEELRAAALDAFNLIDGAACPIDSPAEWRWQVRVRLMKALGL